MTRCGKPRIARARSVEALLLLKRIRSFFALRVENICHCISLAKTLLLFDVGQLTQK